MIIECQKLTKEYVTGDESVFALKDVSFSVEKGEFVAVMGPSGSGKSTLMNILGCLDTPTSGTYRLGETDVSKMSDDELAFVRSRKIGFVFQSFNLLPRISVLRNVMLPLVYSEMSSDKREIKAAEALRAAALPEKFWHHRPNQLSGGMMQRVAIARALVNDPDILLADEPTGNLDSRTGEAVLDTFQRLNCDHGWTIIMITHERYVAEHAGRILTVKDGALMSNEMNTNPRHACNKKESYAD